MTEVKARRRLRLTLTSDTHELHRSSSIPPSDVFIHAGDVSMFSRSLAAVRDFDAWLGEIPSRHKVVTLGNHDEWNVRGDYKLQNARVLVNEAVRFEGLTIWGSPVTSLRSGAFAMPSIEERRKLYRSIPAETDIIVTHGPPFGILDRAPGSDQHMGCMALLEAVQRVQPMIHVFGHVHGAHGLKDVDGTLYVNAVSLGIGGGIARPPVVLELPSR